MTQRVTHARQSLGPEQTFANCWPLEAGIVPTVTGELSGGTSRPGSSEGSACLPVSRPAGSSTLLPQALHCRGEVAIWHFLPSLSSPCSSWWKAGHTWHLGHTCRPRAAGSPSDGSAGPGFLSGRPWPTMPHCSRSLQGACSGRGGPGRKCVILGPGEGLDVLAVSIFLRRKVSGPGLGGKSVLLALFPTASPASSVKRGGGRSCRQAGPPRPHPGEPFPPSGAGLGPCSGSGTPEVNLLWEKKHTLAFNFRGFTGP